MANEQNKTNAPEFWRSNRAAGIGLSVLFVALLVYLLDDPSTFRKLRDGFYMGIISLVAVAGMLLCGISMAFDRLSGELFHHDDEQGRPTWSRFALAIAALVSMYAYYRLMLLIGFPISTGAFVIVLMLVMGVRNVSVLAAASIFITAFVFAAFALLGFDLPTGLAHFN